MSSALTLIVLALPVLGLLIYVIAHTAKDNKVSLQLPSRPDWYK